MADTASSPDKAKDKPKKKKSTSAKDKVNAEQPEEKPEEKKPSKKEKVQSEVGEEHTVPEAATANVADGSRKTSLAVEGGQKTETNRKTSLAEKSSSIADNPEHKRIEKPEETRRKPSYTAPPAATKRDVNLLVDLDEDKLLELKEAFTLFDIDQDGVIDARDLRMTFLALGDNIRDEQVRAMLSEAVTPLDFDAFVILLGYKTIEMDPESMLIEALAQWDYDNSGLISEERIKHDLVTWGDKFTKEEADKALEDAPIYVNRRTGDGMLDYVKFCRTLSGLRKKTKMPDAEDFIKNK